MSRALHRSNHAAGKRRAALLLEVIVALTVVVAALGILGAQLISSMRLTSEAEGQVRAAQFSDRMLALLELDPNLVERLMNDPQTSGDFGEAHPGWFWRVIVEPTDVEGLGLVNLEILYQSDPNARDDINSAGLVRAIHLLKAVPGTISMSRDFGVEQERVDEFTSQFPIPGFDFSNLNPQMLAAMDPQQLLTLLPALLPILQQFAPGLAERLSGGISSPEDLQQLLGELGSGGLPGGAGGGRPGAGPGLPGGMPGQMPGGLPGGGFAPPGGRGGEGRGGAGGDRPGGGNNGGVRRDAGQGGGGGATIDQLNRNRRGQGAGGQGRGGGGGQGSGGQGSGGQGRGGQGRGGQGPGGGA